MATIESSREIGGSGVGRWQLAILAFGILAFGMGLGGVAMRRITRD